MSERVRIDRVEIRVRGGSPAGARALAGELRAALRPALEAEMQRRPAASGRVDRVDAPPVRLESDAPAHRAAATIAGAVANGLARGAGR